MTDPLRVTSTTHPRLYEIDTRSWLSRLSARHGRRIRLGDVPSEEIKAIVELGFDLVWLMGVWKTGAAGRRIWRASPWLRESRARLLPDGSDRDVAGSPFAVAAYEVSDELGGEEGLATLRRRLADAGLGLILDFVPNHTAMDHPWVQRFPQWYVLGDKDLRVACPTDYFRSARRHWVAHGRDPNFPAWPDTAQLDYRNPDVHRAMIRVLRDVATRCDGVRCDMAMLVLGDVVRSTWGGRSSEPIGGQAPVGEFWWHAIHAVREAYPRFLFIAEAYWGLEWRLQQLGFDYTYDKTLLDRLTAGDGPAVAAHLRAEEEYQRRSVRFLENHDEPRASGVFGPERHRAAAVLAATVPGMLMIHEGELDGARLRAPVQFGRRPAEPVDEELRTFYRDLLRVTGTDPFRRGTANRIEPLAASPDDRSHEWIVARLWVGPRRSRRLAVVNLAPWPAQAVLPLAVNDIACDSLVFDDLFGPTRLVADSSEVSSRGFRIDLPPYGYHLFRIVGSRPQ